MVLLFAGCAKKAPVPDLILFDGDRLAELRDAYQAGEAPEVTVAALDRLIALAEEALEEPIVSVVDKPAPPPSGDMHDYTSMARYWWPNPDTEDGLPYVGRDGQTNPEIFEYDRPRLQSLVDCVNSLSLAYFYTGDERYARNAAKRLRVWFLDDETRMNPHLRHAQFVPGVADGRKQGIVDTASMRWLPDSIRILEGSTALSAEDVQGLEDWFDRFRMWLLASEFGREELAMQNNHGAWCAMQLALYSLFVGDEATAAEILKFAQSRIAGHFEPDGSQPRELRRTRSMMYSQYNLRAHVFLAEMGERVGVDLWRYETEDGRGIRRGLEFLVPYLVGGEEWPYQELSPPALHGSAPLFRRAAISLNEPRYEEIVSELTAESPTSVVLELRVPLPADFPSVAKSAE